MTQKGYNIVCVQKTSDTNDLLLGYC